MTTIRCEADLAAGLSLLLTRDPRLCPIADACGPLPLRLSPPGFAGLASIIVSQMVSRASADAMLGRLAADVGKRLEATTSETVQLGAALGRARAAVDAAIARRAERETP